jgi:uncharacterized protein YjdB
MKRFYFTKLAVVIAILSGCSWSMNAQTTTTFGTPGGPYTYTVPVGVTSVGITAAGGAGGTGSTGIGGKGGSVVCSLAVTPGQVLNVYVGGLGTSYNYSIANGGANGGGNGYYTGAGGGGSSDIRVGGTAIANRVIVAAGGGGGANSYCYSGDNGGDGGGNSGSTGTYCSGSYYAGYCGGGATQSAGGAGATNGGSTGTQTAGGNAAYYCCNGAGGGGGGYWGGGGGCYYGGGGGGSSYTGGAGVTNATTTSGTRSGNGVVTICAPTITSTTGPASVCPGSSITLTHPTSGGTWSSSNSLIATVGSTTGIVTGVAAGTVSITYAVNLAGCGGGFTTTSILVNPAPNPVSGSNVICAGSTTPLSDAGGGTWTSSNIGVAIVGLSSGIVTGVAAGTANITYTLPVTGCTTIFPMTVNPLPAAISGSSNVCAGSSTTLGDITTGGTWSSSNTGVAFITPTGGVVTGVAAGSANITYTLPTGCLAATSFVVNPLPNPIAGASTVCVGSSTTLSDLGGGTWSSSNGAIATVNPTLGIVSGISAGSATITYTLPTGCITSVPMLVNPLPAAITGTTSMCVGFNTTLANASPGGTWSSSNLAMATVNPSTGVVSGISAGVPNIIYTLATGCAASKAVSVNALPTVFAVTGGGGYCIGGTGVHVGLVSSTNGVRYKLYNGATLVDSADGTNSGLDFGLKTAVGTYTVVGTNMATGCVNNMSGSVTITISSLPSVYNVTGGGSYCQGGSGMHIYLSNSNTGVNYQLYKDGVSVTGLIGIGGPLDFGLQTAAGTYTVVATNLTSACSSNMIGSPSITINPLPVVYTMNAGGNYCTGGTGLDVVLSGSEVGANYQLYYNGTPSGAPVPGSGLALHLGLHTAAGDYTVVATNATTSCVNNMGGICTIGVSPLPVVYTVTGGGSYCQGGTGVHVNLNYANSGVNYQLFRGVTAIGSPVAGANSSIDFGLQTIIGSYTVVATDALAGCMMNMAGSATVSINPLPNIFNVTGGGGYCAGGTGLHLYLSGSNTGIHYQLYNGVTAVGAPWAGTGSALSLGIFSAPGTYSIVATNDVTSCINNMNGTPAIYINPLPTPYTVTTAGTSYCAGGPGIEILLGSSDAGINYQLYRGSTPVSSPVAGNGLGLNFGFQTAPGVYKVIGTNTTTGCSGVMSNTVTISVNPLPTTFTVTGGGSYCSGGAGVHIGLSGSSVGVNYQLYLGLTAVGVPIAGYGTSLDFGPQTTAGAYTVVAMDAVTGCSQNMTGTVNVNINTLPTIYTVTGGGNYCSGGTGVHVYLSGSDLGIMYQLYKDAVVVGSPVSGTTLGLDFGLHTASGTYTVMAYDPLSGCSSNMISSAVIGLTPLPVAQTVTGGGAYCAGGAGVHVGLSNTSTGVRYQLMHGGPLGAPIDGTGAAIDFGLKTLAGGYTVVATDTTSGGCSNNMTGSANISITPQPTVKTVTGGGSYCVGGTGSLVGVDGSNAGILYQLYNGVTPVGGTMTGTGAALSFGLQVAPGTYTVVASPGGLCQTNMAGSATITATPLPTAFTITGGGNYCSSSTGVTMGLSGSSSGVTYQLYNGLVAVGTPVAGTGSAISFGLQTGVGTYSVMATDLLSTCTNNMTGSGTVAVTMLPEPNVFNVAGGGNYCTGGTGVHVTLVGSNVNVNYQLRRGTTNVGAAMAGTGTSLDFGLETIAGNYTVLATDAGNSCAKTMGDTAVVAIDPILTPVFTVAAHPGLTVKMGQPDTMVATITAGGGTNPTYQWSINSFPVSGATSSKYISSNFANGDVVSCAVTSDGVCGGVTVSHSLAALTVINTTGVVNVTAANSDVRVVPNPNKGNFIISGTLGTTADEDVTLEVTDMVGHVVYSTKAIAKNGTVNERIQLNNVANGMYILSMRSNVENKVFHVVIEQ